VAGDDVELQAVIANPHVAVDVRGVADITQSFRGTLAAVRDQEVAAARNLVGPQRDDLELTVHGRPLREFGSRGEWRTAVVALKLAELEHLAEACGERPVLLLDDVLSELDAERRRLLEPWFTQQQTVFATTDRNELSRAVLEHAAVRTVADGNVQAADELVGATAR
jgi:DNA replication and repair protein RecF